MRRYPLWTVLALLLLAAVAPAPLGAAAPPAPRVPVFITSAGQSSDYVIVKQAVDALGLKSAAAPVAICCDIKSSRTVIIVFGADEKGMMAARLTARTEQRRVEDILGKMRACGLAIIGVYIGGPSESDPVTQRLLDASLNGVHYFIATRSASTDEYFAAAAQKHGFQLTLIDNVGQLQAAISSLFNAKAM